MPLRGSELFLIVRAQNQASNTLRRIGGDIRALTHARDLNTRAERLAIRQASLAAQQQRNIERARDLGPGGSRRLGLDIRAAKIAQQRIGMERELANVETRRMHTNTQILENRKREIDLARQVAATTPGTVRNKNLTMARAVNSRELADLNRTMDMYADSVNTVNRRVRDLDFSQAKLNEDYEKHSRLVTRLAGDNELLARQSRALAAAQLEVRDAMRLQRLEQMQAAGRTTAHIGRAAQLGGLIGTAGLAMAGNQAATLNREATRAATQTGPINSGADVVVANAKRIQDAVIGMMQEIPANEQAITDTFYNIYSSMNATLPQGMRLAKLFGQVWVAGGMTGDIEGVADALITLGNTWKISAGDMGAWNKLAASTLATVRFGRLTVEQYTQTMNQLAPSFRGANQDIEQMNAALAFTTRMMPSTRMSATGLARMMDVLGRFAAKPAAGFEGLAKSIQDAQGNLLPLDKVIGILIKRFPKLETSGVFLTNFFKTISNQQGTVQARRAFQVLIKNFGEYRNILGLTAGDQEEFRRSLTAMEISGGVSWAQMTNDMRAAVLQLGTAVLPVFLKLGGYVADAANWFSKLSDSRQKTIGYFLAIVSVGALVGGTLLAIVGSLAAMVASIAILRSGGGGISKFAGLFKGGAGGAAELGTAVSGATTNVTKLASEAGFISTSGALKLGVFAAIPLLIIYHDRVGDVVGALGGFKVVLGAIMTMLGGLGLVKLVQWLLRLRTVTTLATGSAGLLRTALLGMTALSVVGRFPFIAKLLQGIATVMVRVGVLRAAILGLSSLQIAAIVIPVYFGIKGIQNKEDVNDWLRKKIPGLAKLQDFFNKDPLIRAINERLGGDPDPVARARKAAQDAARATKMHQQFKAADIPEFHAARTVVDDTRGVQATGQRYTEMARAIAEGNLALKTRQQIQSTVNARALAMIPNLRALKAAMEADPTNVAKQLAYIKAQDQLQKLLKKYPALYSAISASIEAMDSSAQEATDNQKALADAAKQAAETARTEMASAATNLAGIYQGMLDKNKAAFGELFEGPWMKSPFIQTGIEWGYEPGIEDMIKDQKAQLAQFNHFNGDLAAIGKKGAPTELVDQLRNLGPDALAKLDQLKTAAPAKFQEFVAAWKKGQTAIKAATKIDFNLQLKQWFSYGKGIAQQIIFGLRSENVALDNAMKKYITDKFPGYVADAVAKAGAQAAKDAPKPRVVAEVPKPKDVTRTTQGIKPQYVLPGKNPGLLEAGNIDLMHRPSVKNKDGSYSTVKAASFEMDGKEILLPEVIRNEMGKWFVGTGKQAVAAFRKTGENLGIFNSIKAANEYADKLHKQQAALYGSHITEAVNKTRSDTKQQQQPSTVVPKRTTQSATVTHNTKESQYHIHTKEMDVSTALRKTKTFDRTHR